MDVSVEITTFNRKDVLRQVLEHLARQTYPHDRFEVVISDDGSTDGLPELVTSMQQSSPLQLRFLRSEHRGPGFAHNRGIERCIAHIVIMLAADVLPVPQFVEEHVKAHREHPEREVVVAGKLVQSEGLPDTAFQRCWNQAVNRLFVGDTGHVHHGGFLVNNISFKRDFMMQEGLFQEWPPASQEDIELGYRLRNRGMRLIKNPRALAFHHHEETLHSVVVRAYIQGYHWHHLEDHLSEAWVRARVGHARPGDGSGRYVRVKLKSALRKFLMHRAVISKLMIPVIRSAETRSVLAPWLRLFMGKVTEFYFFQGRRDYVRGLPSNPPVIESRGNGTRAS